MTRSKTLNLGLFSTTELNSEQWRAKYGDADELELNLADARETVAEFLKEADIDDPGTLFDRVPISSREQVEGKLNLRAALALPKLDEEDARRRRVSSMSPRHSCIDRDELLSTAGPNVLQALDIAIALHDIETDERLSKAAYREAVTKGLRLATRMCNLWANVWWAKDVDGRRGWVRAQRARATKPRKARVPRDPAARQKAFAQAFANTDDKLSESKRRVAALDALATAWCVRVATVRKALPKK